MDCKVWYQMQNVSKIIKDLLMKKKKINISYQISARQKNIISVLWKTASFSNKIISDLFSNYILRFFIFVILKK